MNAKTRIWRMTHIKNLPIIISKHTCMQHLRLRNPTANAWKDKYEYPEWHFTEVANDIRNIRNQLVDKIQAINL